MVYRGAVIKATNAVLDFLNRNSRNTVPFIARSVEKVRDSATRRRPHHLRQNIGIEKIDRRVGHIASPSLKSVGRAPTFGSSGKSTPFSAPKYRLKTSDGFSFCCVFARLSSIILRTYDSIDKPTRFASACSQALSLGSMSRTVIVALIRLLVFCARMAASFASIFRCLISLSISRFILSIRTGTERPGFHPKPLQIQIPEVPDLRTEMQRPEKFLAQCIVLA